MAHVRKFDLAAAVHMCTHYRRGARTYSNTEIDPSRTDQNYNLAPDRNGMTDYIMDRLAEIQHSSRKDLVVMADWVIDLPKDCPKELQEKFFRTAYEFLADRYGRISGLGERVVVSSYVHLDETTPHMHFSFLPVIEKNGIKRFCCKDVLTQRELKSFHQDLQNYLNSHHLHAHVLTGKTKRDSSGRAYSVKELKRQRYLRERDRTLKRERTY